MGQFFEIHPKNPQPRLIKQAVEMLQMGGIIIYPTDAGYAIGCQMANKEALDRIRQLRKLDEKHNFTVMCRDLSEIATYALVSNSTFRLLKAHTPGPYTFILKATKEVPRRLLNPKCKTIGLRVPDCQIVQALLKELNEPFMSISLLPSEQEYSLMDAKDIHDQFGSRVNLVIGGGSCGFTPTTIIDLVEGIPTVLRIGKGDPTPFK